MVLDISQKGASSVLAALPLTTQIQATQPSTLHCQATALELGAASAAPRSPTFAPNGPPENLSSNH